PEGREMRTHLAAPAWPRQARAVGTDHTERPLRGLHRALYVTVAAALLVATGIYAAWWFQPQHIAPNSSIAIINIAYFGLLSLVVWRGLAHNLFLLWLVGGMRRPQPKVPETGSRVAMITCFVPGKGPLMTLEACS